MQVKATSLIAVLAFLCALGAVRAASAGNLDADSSDIGTAEVLYTHAAVVQGNAASVATLNVPGAGELFLTLTDLDFPDPFTSLNLSLSDASTALMGLAQPGTLTLDLTEPTTLYAEVFAAPQTGTDVGAYTLMATFIGTSPVPLPGSGLMLAGGLLALLAQRTRRRRSAVSRCQLLTTQV